MSSKNIVPSQLQDSHELHDLILTTMVPSRIGDFKEVLPVHLGWVKVVVGKYTLECHGPVSWYYTVNVS